jgi:hypothetical protein
MTARAPLPTVSALGHAAPKLPTSILAVSSLSSGLLVNHTAHPAATTTLVELVTARQLWHVGLADFMTCDWAAALVW